jgi:hypothetical protein
MIDGRELSNWRQLRVMSTIKEMGREGWELVGFSHSSSGEFGGFICERPREGMDV